MGKNGQLKGKYQGEASVSQFEEWLGQHSVLKADSFDGVAGDASRTVTSNTAGKDSGTSHFAALSAMARNLLGRFPTKSKIMNMYIYGFAALLLLVGVLSILFKYVEEEEITAAERDKTE